MAICGNFQHVFVVGPGFRAEDSYTPRHLCEYTSLDVEKEINESYYEEMDIVDSLFVEMFDKLNDICQKELGAIGMHHPFKPSKYKYFEDDQAIGKTLRLEKGSKCYRLVNIFTCGYMGQFRLL